MYDLRGTMMIIVDKKTGGLTRWEIRVRGGGKTVVTHLVWISLTKVGRKRTTAKGFEVLGGKSRRSGQEVKLYKALGIMLSVKDDGEPKPENNKRAMKPSAMGGKKKM